MNDNNNETVLITGATSGIGLEFAKIFYSKGYNLVLASRNNDKLEQTKREIKTDEDRDGNTISFYQSDLSKDNSAQELYKKCKADGIVVNILVNNAGVGIYGEHTDLTVTEVEQMINLNVTSLTTLCSLFGKEMKERKAGYILNIASVAAYQAVPYFASYAATKSYVLYFSEALSKEMENHNVVVSCLSPGHTETNFFAEAGIGNKSGGFFSTKGRADVKKVAEHGINILFDEKISSIPGIKNNIITWSNRLVSRKMSANITKYLTKRP
ncbi:MAG: SDR family NAD(P)-dependent oxidoreductase [Candidatus Anammoxibacter sp.]